MFRASSSEEMGVGFPAYKHEAHDSDSICAGLEKNFYHPWTIAIVAISTTLMCGLFFSCLWGNHISKHVMKCGLLSMCVKHAVPNMKRLIKSTHCTTFLLGMMKWWIMHIATARGKRCVLVLIISLGFFSQSKRTNPRCSNWKHMTITFKSTIKYK